CCGQPDAPGVRHVGGLGRDAPAGRRRRRPLPHREALHARVLPRGAGRGPGMSAVPAAKDVRDLLETLLGRDVEVRTGADKVAPVLHGGAAIGIYTDATTRLAAIVAMDVAAAATIGACIGLVPPGAAQDAVESQVLPPSLMDNAAEVLNIMRSLFNTDGA